MRRNVYPSPLDLVVLALIVVIAAVSANRGASRLLWIGDFRGAGELVRVVGCLAGVVTGIVTWVALRHRSDLGTLVATAATVSLFATVPTAADQTSHLLRLYGGMTSAQAERYAVNHVPDAAPAVFDQLRARIPRTDTYLVNGDVPFQTWTRYWLLPRVAVPTRGRADWLIFHVVKPAHHQRLSRIDSNTWIERVRP